MKISIDSATPESTDEPFQEKPLQPLNEFADEHGGSDMESDNEEKVPDTNVDSGEDVKQEKQKLFGRKKGHGEKFKIIIENLQEELMKREEELQTAKNKALLAVADADNFRKRLAREGDEAKRYAASSISEELLPVLDNLEKAVASAKNNEDAAQVDTLRQGVELVIKQLMETLKGYGLKKLKVVGKPFNPETSEAIQMVETDEMEDGYVIDEYIAGYKFKDRVIRPAKVVVAKNPSEERNQQD